MALKDYIEEDSIKILMNTDEFAEIADYISADGDVLEATVREDILTFSKFSSSNKESSVSDERRFYFSAEFQPRIGDHIEVSGVKWKILPPIKREATLWIITVVKSARRNGARTF